MYSTYNNLPEPARRVVRRLYYGVTREPSDDDLHREFVASYFADREEYEGYCREFEDGEAAAVRASVFDAHGFADPDAVSGGIDTPFQRSLYALVRKLRPAVAVETGVCNGVSTLTVLLALSANDSGHLYSVDYPYRADRPLAAFRAETFEGFGGAAIPADREPGWLVPDSLRDRWSLTVGKSQAALPEVACEVDEVDLFVHDSEHSVPCMLFEFELAWAWLSPGGWLLADDVAANDAFERFVEVRTPEHGRVTRNVGYAVRDGGR